MTDHEFKDAAPSEAPAEEDPQEPDPQQGRRRDVSKPEGDFNDGVDRQSQEADASDRKDRPRGAFSSTQAAPRSSELPQTSRPVDSTQPRS